MLGGAYIQQVATEVGMTETRTPRTIRALLYDMVGMDERNPAHTYAMNRELLRTGARNDARLGARHRRRQ